MEYGGVQITEAHSLIVQRERRVLEEKDMIYKNPYDGIERKMREEEIIQD